MRSRADALAWGAAGVLVLLAVALALQRVVSSPSGIVVVQDDRAPWIAMGGPVTAMLQQWQRVDAPVARFLGSFAVAEPSPPAVLAVRAFGEATVFLNGALVSEPDADASSWKRFREVEVSRFLRPGANEVRVDVANLRGPPLLSLRLEGAGVSFATGRHWLAVGEDGVGRPAIPAEERRHPSAYAGERPGEALARSWPVLALVLVPLAGALLLLRARGARRAPDWLPQAALAAVACAWIALFVRKFAGLDLQVGFDAGNHLDYLYFLRQARRIPLATDHWATYHPPLFYLLCLALDGIAGALGAARNHPVALKLIPFLAGLGNVWLASVLVRRVLPGDRSAWSHAILFAGFLPVNVYVAAYFSNEGLHAFLAGAVLLVGVDLLLAEGVPLGRTAALSLLAGLALLTKFTALVVAAPVMLAVALKIAVQGRSRPASLLLGGTALLAPALLVAGWFYARNAIEFGRPIVGNWDLPGEGLTWWSPPGFHTPGYYLRFGEALVRPYFSGFVSFWDGLYSTFWGDGFVAGRASVRARHPGWNYEFMSATYLLALPATVLLASGFLRAAREALRAAAPRRRAALGLLVLVTSALGYAVFYTTLVLPYHGQARASYLLALTPALAVFFASGVRALERWLEARGGSPARWLLLLWLGSLWCASYLGFAA